MNQLLGISTILIGLLMSCINCFAQTFCSDRGKHSQPLAFEFAATCPGGAELSQSAFRKWSMTEKGEAGGLLKRWVTIHATKIAESTKKSRN